MKFVCLMTEGRYEVCDRDGVFTGKATLSKRVRFSNPNDALEKMFADVEVTMHNGKLFFELIKPFGSVTERWFEITIRPLDGEPA